MSENKNVKGKKSLRKRGLKASILSLSLLTVMAGAAVAPALNVIQDYFSDVSTATVQMVISIPAIFIVVTNLMFPAMCRKVRSRTLLLIGLALYVIGGCIAGIFNNIYTVLAARALVGIGVGIIMPMSTGLLAYYYTRDKQDKLLGYSSAMNQLGGAVATLIAGLLAAVSWRLSFLVYLMGLISVVLVMMFLPNENISRNNPEMSGEKKPADSAAAKRLEYEAEKSGRRGGSTFGEYYPYIIGMFILMFTFFIYPSCFAMESAKGGSIPQTAVSVIMALLDAFGFLGGLAYSHIRKGIGNNAKFVAPSLFIIGYAILAFTGGIVPASIGSVIIGFASGSGIPFIISSASQKAGRNAGTTVLPLISAAMYLSQFLTPMILSVLEKAFAGYAGHLPYIVAISSGALLLVWSLTMKADDASEASSASTAGKTGMRSSGAKLKSQQ